VDRVIKEPRHPYTQLLVDSIPQANPKVRWGQLDFHAPSSNGKSLEKIGCAFADRCPSVMAICRQQVPPSFRVHERQAVACFLYENAPVVEPDDVVSTA
jgi:peptide/nickel transport system ATP-binding protein